MENGDVEKSCEIKASCTLPVLRAEVFYFFGFLREGNEIGEVCTQASRLRC